MHRVISLFAAGLAAIAACLACRQAAGAETELVPTPEAPLVGVVNVDRLNVRKGPGLAHGVLGQLSKGTKVVVRHAEGKWYECDYLDSLAVWISAGYVRVEGDVETASMETPMRGVVTRSGVRMRSRPSLARSAMLGERQKDDEVGVAGSFNGWYRIAPPEDMRCYLHSDFVDLVGPYEPGGQSGTSGAGRELPGGQSGPVRLEGGAGRKLLGESDEPDRPDVEEVLPLDLGPGRTVNDVVPTVPREASSKEPPPAEDWAPGSATEGIRLARELLSGTPTIEEAERALRLLEEVLAAAGEPAVREQVKDVLGGVEPGLWLSVIEKARSVREERLEEVTRRYGERLREAREEIDAAAPVEYTARGELRAPVTGSGRHRLMHGGTLLYEIQPAVEEADLSPFVGKGVGVVGEFRDAERPSEAPWILVHYVEELGP